MSANTFKINEKDNVEVVISPECSVPVGHKIALCDIADGENIVKYGNTIGHATCYIAKGEHVHTHNCATNLSGEIEYKYEPEFKKNSESRNAQNAEIDPTQFKLTGYRRPNGRVGIRNELWIVVTVGCVNSVAKNIAGAFNAAHKKSTNFDGCFAITHPYGCSQIGDDHQNTRKALAQIASHPNAGGVLVLGLGCENNQMEDFKAEIGCNDFYKGLNIDFMLAQDFDDEEAEALQRLENLYKKMQSDKRVPIEWSDITIGLKCGGSDGFSGITANPLLGRISDTLAGQHTKIIMSEVPEMFGAEHILMNMCKDEQTFDKLVTAINKFKKFFTDAGEPIYENPSPGNKAGGITTLEDKSLGCIQKCGMSPVNDVLWYAQTATEPGVSLLYGPGNDLVSTTNLGAAGANLVLFTTGRGTPFSSFVPTLKVSTNSALASRKTNWIDFNAGSLLEGENWQQAQTNLLQKIADVINGRHTHSEDFTEREIAIFKTGVTL